MAKASTKRAIGWAMYVGPMVAAFMFGLWFIGWPLVKWLLGLCVLAAWYYVAIRLQDAGR